MKSTTNNAAAKRKELRKAMTGWNAMKADNPYKGWNKEYKDYEQYSRLGPNYCENCDN